MFVTILIFIALIAVLVLVHEAGHFFTAKKAGVKVEEFGFGFPPRAVGIKHGETIYSLNWIPLGGFVKIFGEEGEGEHDPRSFVNRSVGIRSIIIVAGIVMNLVLASVLFSVGHMVGLPTIVEDGANASHLQKLQIQVVDVAENSPVLAAGLSIGDVIVSVDGKKLAGIDEIRAYVAAHAGTEVALETIHDDAPRTLHVVPREHPPQGQGPLGFAMVKTGIERLPWYRAVPEGVKDTFVLAGAIFKGIGKLLAGLLIYGKTNERIVGPLGITVFTDRVLKQGFVHFLSFAGFISVSLGVVNVLPIPALDGGRLLFLFLEKIKGRRVSPSVEAKIHSIAFMILIILILFVTVHWDLPLFINYFFRKTI